MKAYDPLGQTWTVRRRWWPWRPRAHKTDGWDVPVIGDGDEAGVFLVITIVLMIPFVAVFALILAEFLLLLMLLPVALMIRIGITRRWPLVVRRGRQFQWAESVKGWRATGERMRQIVVEIESGSAERGR